MDDGRVSNTVRMCIDRLIRFGWNGVALTYNITSMKKVPPLPDTLPLSESAQGTVARRCGLYVLSDYPSFPQFNRLNLVTDDMQEVHLLVRNLPNLKFDLISITPLSEQVFKSACSNIDIDILCIDVAKPMYKNMSNSGWKDLKAAINRGVAIELLYPRFSGKPYERQAIVNTFTKINHATSGRLSKAKQIILSFGSDDPNEIRSPSDIRNLGRLFQMKRPDEMTSLIPKQIIGKGLARNLNSGAIRKKKPKPVRELNETEDDLLDLIVDAPI